LDALDGALGLVGVDERLGQTHGSQELLGRTA
jgi:hypothetical protein